MAKNYKNVGWCTTFIEVTSYFLLQMNHNMFIVRCNSKWPLLIQGWIDQTILKLFHLGTKMTLQRNLYPKTGAPALNSTYMYVLLVVRDSPLPKKEKKKN